MIKEHLVLESQRGNYVFRYITQLNYGHSSAPTKSFVDRELFGKIERFELPQNTKGIQWDADGDVFAILENGQCVQLNGKTEQLMEAQ